MYSEFLSHHTTHAACDKNLKHWHQGIPGYGFWAILVTDTHWLETLNAAQKHLQALLLPGYARQAHITVSASGLLDERHFSEQHYREQKQNLLANLPARFAVGAGHLNSFTAAPYLAIEDNGQHLLSLRSMLGIVRADDEPETYHPHITLGLYHQAFPSTHVVEQLKQFAFPILPQLVISEIAFCRYQTHKLQGPIDVLERFPFSHPTA